MTLFKSQRGNALQRAKAAEVELYKLYSYLDDLDLDAQADAVNESLESIRAVTKFLHDLQAIDEPKPLVSITTPSKR